MSTQTPSRDASTHETISAEGAAHAENDAGERSHLAHHFDDSEQQYASSKLGMWIFLSTEMLMFGGLFCAYAIYRSSHPEIFRWASVMLDRKLGALNTAILLTSSLTMALAVNAAQRGQRKRLITLLSLTFLGGCGFLGIKYTEYRPKIEHGLLWGKLYAPDPVYVAHHFGVDAPVAHAAESKPHDVALNPARGEKIVRETCSSCHGKDMRGMPKAGVNLLASQFVHDTDDKDLVTFLKSGRQPFDPQSRTNVQMPPRGGNPTLTDDMLRDVVAYLRTLPHEAEADSNAVVAAVAADAGADTSVAVESADVPHSVIPRAADAPGGLVLRTASAVRALPQEPKNVQHFFGIYFLMTGLHAIHVIAGMSILGWLIVASCRGRFGPEYFTPVDLGGLFWHLVDLIWIFLFPLFYLI